MDVMIAEDGPVTRRVLECLLTFWGYDLVTAADRTQACQLEGTPRLAVFGWISPDIGGSEVCRRIGIQSS